MAQRSQINAKDKLEREIDFVNASKDELIEHLCKIIEYEVEKGEDADFDLVRECSDWLDELTADEIVFTPEELEAKLEALKSGKDVPISHQHKPHPATSAPRIQRKVFARVGILVAAIMLLSVLSLSVMAKHAGYSSTWEYISTNVGKLFSLNSGEVIDEDSISIVKNNEKVCYENMAALVKGENLDILYPEQMPANLKITEIRFVLEDDNNYTLYFTFSNGSYIFNVTNYYLSEIDILNEYNQITYNNLNFYIKEIETGLYYAILQHNGFEYTIQTPSYDDLLIILNSLKG